MSTTVVVYISKYFVFCIYFSFELYIIIIFILEIIMKWNCFYSLCMINIHSSIHNNYKIFVLSFLSLLFTISIMIHDLYKNVFKFSSRIKILNMIIISFSSTSTSRTTKTNMQIKDYMIRWTLIYSLLFNYIYFKHHVDLDDGPPRPPVVVVIYFYYKFTLGRGRSRQF